MFKTNVFNLQSVIYHQLYLIHYGYFRFNVNNIHNIYYYHSLLEMYKIICTTKNILTIILILDKYIYVFTIFLNTFYIIIFTYLYNLYYIHILYIIHTCYSYTNIFKRVNAIKLGQILK